MSHASTDCFADSGSDRLCLELGHALGQKKRKEKGLGVPKNPHTMHYYITATHTEFQLTYPHILDVKG